MVNQKLYLQNKYNFLVAGIKDKADRVCNLEDSIRLLTVTIKVPTPLQTEEEAKLNKIRKSVEYDMIHNVNVSYKDEYPINYTHDELDKNKHTEYTIHIPILPISHWERELLLHDNIKDGYKEEYNVEYQCITERHTFSICLNGYETFMRYLQLKDYSRRDIIAYTEHRPELAIITLEGMDYLGLFPDPNVITNNKIFYTPTQYVISQEKCNKVITRYTDYVANNINKNQPKVQPVTYQPGFYDGGQ